MFFGKPWKLFRWNFKENIIEQIKHFQYLGIQYLFIANTPGFDIVTTVLNSARVMAQAIDNFHFNRGNSYVPVALKVFNAKIIPKFYVAFRSG